VRSQRIKRPESNAEFPDEVVKANGETARHRTRVIVERDDFAGKPRTIS
jgi:hypothetical protein